MEPTYETIRFCDTNHFCQFRWSFSQIDISHHHKVSWHSLVITETHFTTTCKNNTIMTCLYDVSLKCPLSLQHKLLGGGHFSQEACGIQKSVQTTWSNSISQLLRCIGPLLVSTCYRFSSTNHTMANKFITLIIIYTPYPNIHWFLLVPAGAMD